ncbi:ParB N-terminal domain-containing protein [Sedimentitalea sp. XS_ASV28]|uniref:ParB N-terminal domain-containing protein n=1 Tax=Sedimentitalea sp. XS_ASV28 TaxID=3241296 RepID=UPI003513F126
MTKQQTITADGTIQHIPLEKLYITDLNPRTTVSEAHIDSLADSIERFGLIHNLAGILDSDGKVGIVAGGCRLRAIQKIVERSEGHPFATLPVKLATDAAEAEDWASAENAAREDMTPADEIRAFGRMKKRGASVPEIALAFAVSEARVYQRLALAGLPEPVLDALAAGEISLGTAKAFTLSQDEALTLDILVQVKGQAVSEAAIKNALHPDAIKATDRRARFVGIEAYEVEGGTVTRDLFSDEVFLASPALLDRLFEEKLDAARADLVESEGWAWAEARREAWLNYYELDQMNLARLYPVEGDLTEDETQEYDELADLANGGVLDAEGEARLAVLQAILDGEYSDDQKAHSGCILLVNNAGKGEVPAGLVRAEDKKAAIEAGVLQAPQMTKPDAPKSPYSQKLVADMQAIRLAAVQAALLAKPELVLDLLGFGLSEASGSFESVFGFRLERPTNVPSVEDGFDHEPRLDHGTDPTAYWQNGTRVEDLSEAFAIFREDGKKARNAKITEAIARTLPYQAGGAEFFGLIAEEAGAEIRKHWTPTAENFFSRVSAGHLVDLLCEFLDCDARDERAAAFAKLKKAEKADKMEKLVSDPTTQKLMKLTPEQKTKLDTWVPDCT